MVMFRTPASTASSMTYWISGLSTRGSISLGWAFVAGRNRVPNPAAGKTAFAIRISLPFFTDVIVVPIRGSLYHRADSEPSRPVEKVHGHQEIVVHPFTKRLVSGNVWITLVR